MQVLYNSILIKNAQEFQLGLMLLSSINTNLTLLFSETVSEHYLSPQFTVKALLSNMTYTNGVRRTSQPS